MIITTPITKRQFIIDDEDYDKIKHLSWRVRRDCKDKFKERYYVVSRINGRTIRLHGFLLNAQKGELVDHINRNTLDNRKCNLRIANDWINSVNRRKYNKIGTSIYKGVCWKDKNKKWCSQIMFKGKKKHIGLYNTEEEAALAYNKIALELFGSYAFLNCIDTVSNKQPEEIYD